MMRHGKRFKAVRESEGMKSMIRSLRQMMMLYLEVLMELEPHRLYREIYEAEYRNVKKQLKEENQ